MKNYSPSQLILVLTPFVFTFAFGLDIYIPIVPQMSEIFETTPSLIQLTLSLFLFTTGFGQLFIGPFSDQFGRRPIFYISALTFAFGALGCAFSPHVTFLIISRFISSLGACGMLVTSFAIVRDLFSSEKSAKMYSFLNGAVAISPTFAPILGGYLSIFFGWQSVFFFLSFLGFFSLFVTKIFVKETLKKEDRVKVDSALLSRYFHIFTHRQFILYSLLAGLAEGIFFCFFSISPFIIIEEMGVPTHQFGYYFSLFGAMIGLGGFGSGKLIEKIGIHQTMGVGIGLMLIGGVSMLICHYLTALTLWGFLLPMAASCMGAMFLIGGSASAALEPFGNTAGTASAAFGAIQFGLSAIIGSLLLLFPTTSQVPYGISIILISLLSLPLFLQGKALPLQERT